LMVCRKRPSACVPRQNVGHVVTTPVNLAVEFQRVMISGGPNKEQFVDRQRLNYRSLIDRLKELDEQLALKAQREGCLACGGRLHRADYPRRLREPGAVNEQRRVFRRISFCCEIDTCRKRLTPPSLRFLGRRRYDAVVVVLASMAVHGLKGPQLAAMSATLGIARTTLARWCAWWRDNFLKSDLWSVLRSRLVPPVDAQAMPRALFDRIRMRGDDRLVEVLRLVSPWGVTSSMAQRIARSGFPL
jgi:hypothetical protein